MVEGFKHTEVGFIPNDWAVKRIGECLLGNPDYGINAAAVPYNENLPVYLRITDITEDGNYSKKNLVSVNSISSASYFLKEGDLVFARTGASVGKTYLYNPKDGKLVFAGFLIRVRANEGMLLPKYLKYFTQTKQYWDWIAANSMRTGQPGVNGNEYKELRIPLPPTIAEQTSIANALNDADALVTQLEKLIAKKRAIKQGAMQELLRPKEGWEEKPLTDFVDYIHGKAHEKHIDENGKYVVVNSKFISSDGTIAKYSNHNFCPAKKGDVLTVLSDLPNGKALAKCYYVAEDRKYAVNQRICIWRSKGSNPKFLFFVLNRHKYFIGLDDGISQTHILNHHIEKCRISVPKDTNEQTRIAAILSNMDTELEALEKKLEKYKMFKQGMMQNLLTGKIRLI